MVIHKRTSRVGAQALAVVWHLCAEPNVRVQLIAMFIRKFNVFLPCTPECATLAMQL